MNRLTITLDDDVYAMVRSHAIATRTSLSKAIADLMRQRRVAPGEPDPPLEGRHPVSGFPVSKSDGRILSDRDVLRAIDDDLRGPMESLGLTSEEIEDSLK